MTSRSGADRHLRPFRRRRDRADRHRRQPAIYLIAQYCRDHAEAWDCQKHKDAGSDPAADPGGSANGLTIRGSRRQRSPLRLSVMPSPRSVSPRSRRRCSSGAPRTTRSPQPTNGDIVKARLPKPPEDHLVPTPGISPFSRRAARRWPRLRRHLQGRRRFRPHRVSQGAQPRPHRLFQGTARAALRATALPT